MIFTTVNNDLTSTITGVSTLSNKMGILGNSFQDIIESFQAYGKAGLNIFANTTTDRVTSMDIEILKNFSNEISNGVPKVQALENTMFGASKGARDLAMSADTSAEGISAFNAKINTLQITEKGYIATTIGARIATVAFQTALSFGLAWAIQGLITLFQNLAESIPTVENTTKWLTKSSQEVQNTQSKIKSLNSELETTQKLLKIKMLLQILYYSRSFLLRRNAR